jgi:hypothetical protein
MQLQAPNAKIQAAGIIFLSSRVFFLYFTGDVPASSDWQYKEFSGRARDHSHISTHDDRHKKARIAGRDLLQIQ